MTLKKYQFTDNYIIYLLYIITMQFATDGRSSLDFNNAFKTDSVPSLSRALEWQNDLDYVYAISNISVSMTKVCVICNSLPNCFKHTTKNILEANLFHCMFKCI